MEEENRAGVEPAKKQRKSPGARKGRKRKRYPFEFRLRLVKGYLEEQYPLSLLHKESGAAPGTIYAWVRRYRSLGEAGLQNRPRKRNAKRLPGPVVEKILSLKKENRLFGSLRISQLLRRVFWLKASPEAVRHTLKAEGLLLKPPSPRKKNVDKPRFFERATPNQMWQSDIFMFRLGGQNAYLIGFIDDYSRYIVGLELFRSQTGESVLEVLRRAFGEYGIPKEMLTDNGRQYASWRGNTRFQGELRKEKIHHIRSQPHHPMTLGKIERFWASIYEEFLVRAQFSSFEEARERIAKWVKYYNHRRPHQGIGGLCPADRFFEVAAQLRKTIEQGIEENILEMALRGKPKAPFYMVGRMDGQSVVLRAEKGKLRLRVEDEENGHEQEITYALKEEENASQDKDGRENADESENVGTIGARIDGALPGGAIGVDGAAEGGGSVPGSEGGGGGALAVAEAGAFRDVAGPGTKDESAAGRGAFTTTATLPGEGETKTPSPKDTEGTLGKEAGGAGSSACADASSQNG